MLAEPFPSEFFQESMYHVALAIVCGGIIGLERQLRGKPVGLRPCIIVVLVTAMLIDLGNSATQGAGDPSRMMSAIVTGVGFLGGGVILAKAGQVQGVTTAALVWALAAIGIAIGLDFGPTALALTLIIMAVMMLVDWAESRFPRLRSVSHRRKE